MAPRIGNRPSDLVTDEQYRERLRSKCIVDTNGGCWLYQGFRHRLGYGEMSYRNVSWRVHRLAYVLWKGEIPVDLDVMHSCDVRHCCNPDHLSAGAHRDNLLDCLQKGRQPRAAALHCKRGHRLEGENLAVKPNGARGCKTCDRARQRIEMGWPEALAYSMPPSAPGFRPVNGHQVRKGTGRKLKTVCIHGHPLIGRNLYVTSEGRRRCRACHHVHVRRTSEKHKQFDSRAAP